jgi:predicted nucleotidyltransferase
MKRIIKHTTAILKDRPGIAAAYLLGSVLTGAFRDDSDIDIALLPDAGCSFSLQERLDLAATLESSMGRTVDIGTITPSNLIYASEAILRGRRIITRNKDYADAMETRLLGCYSVLKQDRQEVEKNYRAA